MRCKEATLVTKPLPPGEKTFLRAVRDALKQSHPHVPKEFTRERTVRFAYFCGLSPVQAAEMCLRDWRIFCWLKGREASDDGRIYTQSQVGPGGGAGKVPHGYRPRGGRGRAFTFGLGGGGVDPQG